MNKKFFSLLGCVALTLASATPASAVEAQKLQISRLGDTEMSCAELSKEAVTMRDIVNATEEIKDDSKLQDRGITAAGAVGSFLIGTVTGGIGLAAAGFMASQQVEATSDTADNIQDIAEQRRSFMIGIYNAKGCEGPIEDAMLTKPPTGIAKQLNKLESAAGIPGADIATAPEDQNLVQTSSGTAAPETRAVDRNSDGRSTKYSSARRYDPQAAAAAAAELKSKTYND